MYTPEMEQKRLVIRGVGGLLTTIGFVLLVISADASIERDIPTFVKTVSGFLLLNFGGHLIAKSIESDRNEGSDSE